MPAISAPVFIALGTADRTRHGRRLAEASGDRATMTVDDGGTHGDLPTRGLINAMDGFVRAKLRPSG